MSLTQPSEQNTHEGCIAFSLQGEDLIAHHASILWWPREQTLVVADLHLEKGSSFALRGQFLPPYDSRETLARLGKVVAQLSPRRIIALGDSFHDNEAAKRLGLQERAVLAQLQKDREWVWVSGNHDPVPPLCVGGKACDELRIGNLVFRHEPEIGALGEIAGHLHPCAKVRSRSRSVRRPCFVANDGRLILPAFGALTGGLNICDKAYTDLLSKGGKTRAFTVGRRRVYELPLSAVLPDFKRAKAN